MPIFTRLACFLLLLASSGAFAQAGVNNAITLPDLAAPPDTGRQLVVRNILIAGNRRTNPNIILRELPFQIDEQYSLELLNRKFEKARKQLMNTGLFRSVTVSLKNISGYDVYVSVVVDEKWYIWPQPFLKPVDRTFHEWWSDKNRSMDRINYGVRLNDNNFTGRNDKLKVVVMSGYTHQLSMQYYGLYLDNELKWSVDGGFAVGKNREVNYMTRDNKLIPVRDRDQFLHTYNTWFAELNYRPAIKTRHTFGIGFNYEDFSDTVYKLNPHFASGHNIVRYPEIGYKLSYYDVDFIPYPTKGVMAEVLLQKKGFSGPVNLWQLTAKGSKTWPVSRKSYFNLRAVGMLKLPFSQPYLTRQFLGYDDQYMQGYEYYVIDGVAGGYTKATLARQVVNTHFSIGSRRWKKLNDIPFRLYAKTFVDAGYVYNRYPGQNQLTNTFLYSGGVGVDIVTFTDFVIKIEWSFNRLGENGLYLHQRNNF